MINVVRYTPYYFAALKAMLEKQQSNILADISERTLPKIGFVALYESDDPVAVGFLRLIEGGYAQIDTLATDPYFNPSLRDRAINLIYSSILDHARAMEIPGLLIITENDSVIKRAHDCGFKIIKQTLLGLPLEG